MQVIEDIDELRRTLAARRPVAFVPTMGNLHAGHVALVNEARRYAETVVVSIFVNRLQFGPSEDFARYPRTFEADCAKLREAGTSIVFAPDERTLYPEPQSFLVEPPPIANELEGRFRPRFFHGVATVVLKLFSCVGPDVALFGKKDYQQLMVIRGMVRQFNLPIDIVAGETVRDTDGLALSSRNGYLSPRERAEAPRLRRTLLNLAEGMRREDRSLGDLETDAMTALRTAGWEPDYVAIRVPETLAPPHASDRTFVALAAARLGSTRLIDNIEFTT